jgi:hypothetical protein
MRSLSLSILSVLIIAAMIVQIYTPAVEASVIYGPLQYKGDWYRDPISNGSGRIVNGSCPVINGSGQMSINGIPVDGNALSYANYGSINPSVTYTGQFLFPGDKDNGPAFDDYKRLMGQYRPDMHFDNDGGIRLNGMKSHDDAGSDLVFKFLGKYVRKDNFTINSPHGNYTLYLRNGDSTGKYVENGTIFYVRLNGKDVFTPCDYSLSNQVLKKKVNVSQNNTLEVFAVGAPGSYMTVWLEDESPGIVVISPWDDTVSNGTILLAGYTTDHNVTSITVKQSNNSTTATIPVTNGNFSTDLQIMAPVKLNLTAIDSTGTLRSASLCLDGDRLPEKAERQLGFDPLNPDSDSKLTATSEAGNGVIDGYEILGGQNANGMRLPAFIKAEVHADPLKDDSDGDGLSDYFEVMKLGPYADPSESDHDGNGVSDALEDADNDNLTNIEEQAYGADPLLEDTDNDGLKDGYEVKVSQTDPLSKDSDNDGLPDDSEIRLGTEPNDPDTNNNGILDGNESYASHLSNVTLGISVSVVGKGDLGKELTIRRVTSEHYTNVSALVSPLVDVSVNGSIDYALITMQYDPSLNASNLSLCYYNESRGLYVPVDSHVDAANHTISANVTHLSDWGIFEVKNLLALYKMASDFNNEPYNGTQPSYPQPGDTLFVPYNSTLIMTYLGGTAGYNNKFGLWSPSRVQYGTGHGTSPGTRFNLGNYTRGTELIFYIDNGVGNTWLSGPGSRNPDGIAHAYIKPITNDTWLLGWEDLYGGGDRDYDDVVLNLTFTRSAMLDTDGDGLLDDVETHGYMDAMGRYYKPTDPNDTDSDDDGLKDGEEVGELHSDALCGNYYDLYSDPKSDDSDNDNLGDFDEIKVYCSDPFSWDSDWDLISDGIEVNVIGSDPTSGDTDGDGYPDLFEYAYSDKNPSVPGFLPSEVKFDPCAPDMAAEKRALEFTTGALSGEYYAQDHDNLYYLSGWMSVGFIPGISDIADVRDLLASVILKESADSIGLNGLAVIIDVASDLGYLSVIGAIPGYLASTISTEVEIGLKFLGHHPKFIGDVLSMIFIVAKLDNNIGTQVKAAIQAFDKVGVNGDEFYKYLKGKGVDDTRFVAWSPKLTKDGAQVAKDFLDNGHSVQEVDYVVSHLDKNVKLEDVQLIGTKTIGQNNAIYWLDNKGVTHVVDRHVTGIKLKKKGITSFWPTGNNVRPGYTTPSIMNMDNVEQMIQDSMKNGHIDYIDQKTGNIVYRWELQNEQYGIKTVITVTSPSGKILTSYPVEGSSVLVYDEVSKSGKYINS